MICDEKYEKRMEEEDFGDSDTGRIRKYLWNLTEYPETSLAARVSIKIRNNNRYLNSYGRAIF